MLLLQYDAPGVGSTSVKASRRFFFVPRKERLGTSLMPTMTLKLIRERYAVFKSDLSFNIMTSKVKYGYVLMIVVL